MKLQLGLLHTDQSPAEIDDLDCILGAHRSTRSETSGEIVHGPLAMAYRGDRITWEEENETQPLRHQSQIVTFDGRLDNREHLGHRFGITDLAAVSDPLLVALAYSKAGGTVFGDLIGEFALCLWCQNNQSLLLARSACGARPLYYIMEENRIIWSSSFSHLVRVSHVDLALDEEYLVKYLSSQPSPERSPLAKIKPVPPNTLLRFTNAAMPVASRLWNPNTIAPLQCRSDVEYEEQFQDRLTEAIRVRLRAKHSVFAELSGGLDSSSVVLMVDRILRTQNKSAGNFQTMSCVYEESETCDEKYFIRAVEQARGIPGLYVPENDQKITVGLASTECTAVPNPLHCFPGRYPAFAALMQAHQARVLLTGLGGDHLFWSATDGSPVVADHLCSGHLLRAHRECQLWSRCTGIPYIRLLFKEALPLCGWSLPTQYSNQKLPSWLAPKHKKRVSRDHAQSKSSEWMPGRRAQVRMVQSLFDQLSAADWSEYDNIYISHPYTHRPLVEFCIAAPITQFVRNGHGRSLMRRALKNLLPPVILRRKSKGVVDEAIARAVRREWAELGIPAKWHVCEQGYVDPKQLLESLNRTRFGLPCEGSLVRVFSLERWLRFVDHGFRNSEQTNILANNHQPPLLTDAALSLADSTSR